MQRFFFGFLCSDAGSPRAYGADPARMISTRLRRVLIILLCSDAGSPRAYGADPARLISTRLRRVLIILLCVAALGCGDDAAAPDAGNADVPPGPMPIRVEDLCTRAITVFCAANAACCGDPAESYATLETCVADQTPLCNDADRGVFQIESVEGGRLLYSQAAGRAAIDRLRAAGEACTPIRFADELAAAFTGTLTEGAPCAPLECASGLACAGGTCVPENSAGDPCGAADPCVGDALHCDEASATCAAVGAGGAACTDGAQCASADCDGSACAPFDADHAYCVRIEEPERDAFER